MNRLALSALIGTLIGLLIVGVGYYVFSLNYFYVSINGNSMVPVLQDGDRAIIKKAKRPTVGDVVVFNLPQAWEKEWKGEPDPQLIKRIALEPGDELSWDGEFWRANGEVFSGIRTGACGVEPMETTLGEGQYFVTGDTTTGKTLDSREAFCKGLPFLVAQADIVHGGSIVKVF